MITTAVASRSDPGPSQWDPRIADLVTFVERTRERTFDHPVEIRFATDREIDDELVGDDGDGDWTEWAEIEEGRYRAQGLADGDFDVLSAYDEQLTVFAVAFYEPDSNVMWVPMPDDPDAGLPVMLRSTIVHELVHALQDQMDGDVLAYDSGDDSVRQAFIEGDASEVEARYIDALSDADFEEYLSYWDGPESTPIPALQDSPAAIDAEFGAPYYLGAAAVHAIVDEQGWSAIDAILADPPWSVDAFFDPLGYVAADPDTVEYAPQPNVPEQLIEWGGTSGPVMWYLSFAEFMPPDQAFEAARDWKDDQYLVYTERERVCMKWNVLTDANDAAGPFDRAVRAWADESDDREMSANARATTVTSCDPGPDADLDLLDDFNPLLAYAEIVVRAESAGLAFGLDPATARCATHEWFRGALPDLGTSIQGAVAAVASTFDTTSCRQRNPYLDDSD